MAQILVRGISEADMATLSARAERLGRSREQEVRLLIARAAEEERGWAEHIRRSDEFRASLKGRSFSDSTKLIREERDRR